jgi:hypothetical protein
VDLPRHQVVTSRSAVLSGNSAPASDRPELTLGNHSLASRSPTSGQLRCHLLALIRPRGKAHRRRRRPITRCCYRRAGLAGSRSRPSVRSIPKSSARRTALLACSLGPQVIGSCAQTHPRTAMKRVHPTDKHVGNRLRMRRLMLTRARATSPTRSGYISAASKVREWDEPH